MVFVHWMDSALNPDWIKLDDISGVAEIKSIGYLIFEDDEHIEIAQNKTKTHMSAIMSIPKSVILERRNLVKKC